MPPRLRRNPIHSFQTIVSAPAGMRSARTRRGGVDDAVPCACGCAIRTSSASRRRARARRRAPAARSTRSAEAECTQSSSGTVQLDTIEPIALPGSKCSRRVRSDRSARSPTAPAKPIAAYSAPTAANVQPSGATKPPHGLRDKRKAGNSAVMIAAATATAATRPRASCSGVALRGTIKMNVNRIEKSQRAAVPNSLRNLQPDRERQRRDARVDEEQRFRGRAKGADASRGCDCRWSRRASRRTRPPPRCRAGVVRSRNIARRSRSGEAVVRPGRDAPRRRWIHSASRPGEVTMRRS